MTDVSMRLGDPAKAAALGIPQATRKTYNPFYTATELEREGKSVQAEGIYLDLLNNDFDNPAILAAFGMNQAVLEKNGVAFRMLAHAYDNVEGVIDGLKRVGITPKTDSN